MWGFPRTNLAILFVACGANVKTSWARGMSTLEIDVGDLKARAVEFTATDLVVTLVDGRKIVTPLDWYPRLQSASAAEREHYEIMPMGIHWPLLDEDLSIAGMLKGRHART
jgi:hypothetical protein